MASGEIDQVKASVRAAYDAINRREFLLLESRPGFQHLARLLPRLLISFPDLSAEVEQQTVEGDCVTTRAILHGTHRGAFLGVEPSGKHVEIIHIVLERIGASACRAHALMRTPTQANSGR